MKKNNPTYQQLLENLFQTSNPQEAIKQLWTELEKNGINLPKEVGEIPSEIDKLMHDPSFTQEIGDRLEILSQQIKEEPDSIHHHMNTMFQEMKDEINLPAEVTKDTFKNAKASARENISKALKGIKFGPNK